MEKCVTLVFDFRSYLGLSTFFLPLLPLFLQDVGSVGPIVRLSEAIWFFKVSLNKVARLLWNVSTYFFAVLSGVYPQFRLVPTVGTSDRGTTFSSCCKCEKIKSSLKISKQFQYWMQLQRWNRNASRLREWKIDTINYKVSRCDSFGGWQFRPIPGFKRVGHAQNNGVSSMIRESGNRPRFINNTMSRCNRSYLEVGAPPWQ